MATTIELLAKELKHTTGVYVYVVDHLKLEKETDPGLFYAGDCYVIYYGRSTTDGKIVVELFAWIGRNSDDEEFYAAYNYIKLLSKEIPNVISFEVERQMHESAHFIDIVDNNIGFSYYGGGMKYANGNSRLPAFHKEDVGIYQLKGDRNPVLIFQPFSIKSLNQGDAFVINCDSLYLFQGKSANEKEIQRAHETMTKLSKLHPDHKQVILPKGQLCQELIELFEDDQVPDASEGGEDWEASIQLDSKISMVNGEDFVCIVSSQDNFKKDLLDSRAIYVIQNGGTIIIWVGKELPDYCKEITMAYDIGSKYIIKNNIPKEVSISVVIEGYENEQFKLLFN